MILIGWIFNLLFLLLLVAIVVGNIVRVIILFRCFSKRECSDKNCHLKTFCHKYQEPITQETLDCLTKMLEERRRELEEDNS